MWLDNIVHPAREYLSTLYAVTPLQTEDNIFANTWITTAIIYAVARYESN